MGSLEDALGHFSPGDVAKIRAKLDEWYSTPVGIHVVKNIQREVFLPVGNMINLLNVVLNHESSSIDVLERNYREECRKIHNTRQGPPITLTPLPTKLGRTVSTSKFFEDLKAIDSMYFDDDHAVDFVVKLINGDPLSPNERDTFMTEWNSTVKRSAWVTWNKTDPTGDPFYFASTNDPDEIRANLGLVKGAEPMLLLRYTRKPSLILLYPTVADAGSYKNFQTAGSVTMPHGLTQPWFEPHPYNASPQAEAIHGAEKFDCLDLPVEERP